jgi:hypothetical protein
MESVSAEEVHRNGFSTVRGTHPGGRPRSRQDQITRPHRYRQAFHGELIPQDPNDEPASELPERTKENPR